MSSKSHAPGELFCCSYNNQPATVDVAVSATIVDEVFNSRGILRVVLHGGAVAVINASLKEIIYSTRKL